MARNDSDSDGSRSGGDEDIVKGFDVIVMHPGAQFLRIGLAKNPFPHAMLHAIARKIRTPPEPNSQITEDESESDSENSDTEMVEAVIKTTDEAKSATQSSDAKVTQYNKTVVPEAIPKHMDDQEVSWKSIDEFEGRDYAVGDELLTLNHKNAKIFFPCRYGLLDVPNNCTYEAVRADLIDIWTHAVENVVGIAKKDFHNYRILLLIPDSYRKRHVRIMMEVLLEEMGFSALYMHQESVCAMFGAGLSHACVVDVGASKLSVCCVEEGMSIPETRVTLRYGGDDITRELHTRLGNVSFPYKNCDLTNTLDWNLMCEFKEKHCHVVPRESLNAEPIKFTVRNPTATLAMNYSFRISHDAVKSPMLLFNFKSIASKQTRKHSQTRNIIRDLTTRLENDNDPTDIFDDSFISDVSTLQYPMKCTFNQVARNIIRREEVTPVSQPLNSQSNNPIFKGGMKTERNGDNGGLDVDSKSNGIEQATEVPSSATPVPSPLPPIKLAVPAVSAAAVQPEANIDCSWKGCTTPRDEYPGPLLEVWNHVMKKHVPLKAVGGHICDWEGCTREPGKVFANKASFMTHLRTHIPILSSQMSGASGRVTPHMSSGGGSAGGGGSGGSGGGTKTETNCYAVVAQAERARSEKDMLESVEMERKIAALRGIDEVIAWAISRCGQSASGVGAGEDIMKKMYTSILLVGGGQMFRGYSSLLEQRLYARVPAAFRKGAQKAVQVIESPKDMDARMLAWKGGSILARLDLTDAFWIEKDEWLERGVGVLRDVLPFIWSTRSKLKRRGYPEFKLKQVIKRTLRTDRHGEELSPQTKI
eukprot:CFRG8119T1